MWDGAVARALVLEAPRDLVVREFAVPAVGDDDALVRRCVRLEDAEELLATMAGERDGVPPVHGVLTP